ncbi:family 20 glycosylhydrolase [Bacteroides sp. OttesenSCG-928-J23]|nr:family 20 glycosylhydrolase [Bacteroides sp. OttesenSCG-928-N06]MDL2247547.1 family 20 glycosylhydrolase [Bacteroides sp. OttesenSCG-928-J23]MDL2299090.1 family 20 glycosylhydrolase [Bacteroides sp. OttesenSCG-928-E20]MDL2304139.1 family 20 glycosylhydrolase [Bacteroides sp. OttesenSCG-928-D19]
MKKFIYTSLITLSALLSACNGNTPQANYQVIPLPQQITCTQAQPFVLTPKTRIIYTQGNELLKQNAGFLATYINQTNGIALAVEPNAGEIPPNTIALALNPSVQAPEGYQISITPQNITIEGSTEAGIFYGIQTLRKSLPITQTQSISLPAAQITDQPRFAYRGMHLDVSRHFFTIENVKTYIDMLALHNINNLHWHLTDDQGWRIEIKKYPGLTDIGSTRKRTVIGRNSGQYDETPYGGYYTQEQIKEVVEYAAERYINIVPEIDLPGHMLAALAAYPQYGCTGGPYEVEPTWGIFADVICIGNDQAMTFLEDVLAEVVELFPSKLIHIGGDEAPRDRWKLCPKCQARIKDEGLKADKRHTAEDRLQSYCTKRMENFLNSKGRSIIGWDEILEGDVAPNATVMSWRGTTGGLEAARLGHDVIMTPNSYVYFDYYETNNLQGEPLGIGGYLSLEKVYSMEPAPDELTPDEKKHIIGAQANLWTEYIPTFEHAQYMVLPRMAALAEVQWTAPQKKDYAHFAQRVLHQLDLYTLNGYNYAKHLFDVNPLYTRMPQDRAIRVELNTIDGAPIYYTLDGSEPTTASTRYQEPFLITNTAQFRAAAIRPQTGSSKVVTENFEFNKATFRPITLLTKPSRSHTYEGEVILADALMGGDNFASGRWLGFVGTDAVAIIDLQEPTKISSFTTHANIDVPSWVMGITKITVEASNNNQQYTTLASKKYDDVEELSTKKIETYTVNFEPTTTRYLKISLSPSNKLPKGHGGEGRPAFIFVDELVVE